MGKEVTEEVWIQSGPGIPIDRLDASSGDRSFFAANLSDILPAALEMSTPIRSEDSVVYNLTLSIVLY